jgi:hypothetical protein
VSTVALIRGKDMLSVSEQPKGASSGPFELPTGETPGSLTRSFGDYEIIHEIARGGMASPLADRSGAWQGWPRRPTVVTSTSSLWPSHAGFCHLFANQSGRYAHGVESSGYRSAQLCAYGCRRIVVDERGAAQ